MTRTILVTAKVKAWGKAEHGIELLLKRIQSVQRGAVILNMRQVTFLRPYAVLMLTCIRRYLFQVAGVSVEFRELSPDVHGYLERAKFFEVGHEWLHTNQILPDHARLDESPVSDRLLSMTFIRTEDDIYAIASAESIPISDNTFDVITVSSVFH